ncbi:response regulator transcription factor, partial [Phaeovibrio sulfidiphilus]
MRVLVVEDDLSTQKAVELILKREGWAVDLTSTGEEAFDFVRAYEYDALIVDLSLPDTDGIDLIRRMRAARVQTPVVILSGYGEAERKVRGLDVGADDYVTKPYDRSELVARIQAVVRRSMGHARSVVQIGRLEIDLASHTARVGGEMVPLTAKEYAILELLALRKGA